MKKTMTALVFGVLFNTVSVANASTAIEATGFSLASTGGTLLDMDVLWEQDGATVIGLSGGGLTAEVPSPTEGYSILRHGLSQLTGAVQPGYRITSLTLFMGFDGALSLVDMPAPPGYTINVGTVGNSASVNWSLASGGSHFVLPGIQLNDFIGSSGFEQTSGQSVDGAFELNIDSTVSAIATPTRTYSLDPESPYGGEQFDNYAMINSFYASLTVQVSAVPEPGTYAMLLGGLGVLWVGRRRGAGRVLSGT